MTTRRQFLARSALAAAVTVAAPLRATPLSGAAPAGSTGGDPSIGEDGAERAARLRRELRRYASMAAAGQAAVPDL